MGHGRRVRGAGGRQRPGRGCAQAERQPLKQQSGEALTPLAAPAGPGSADGSRASVLQASVPCTLLSLLCSGSSSHLLHSIPLIAPHSLSSSLIQWSWGGTSAATAEAAPTCAALSPAGPAAAARPGPQRSAALAGAAGRG